MWREECSAKKLLLEHNAPNDFVKSYWQKREEVLLIWVIYRCAIFMYFFVAFIVIIFFSEVVWYKNFVYYTYWSYTVQLVAFTLAFAITAERFSQQKKNPNLPPLERMPRHYKALWCIYTIAAPTSVVVTIVFCLFVYSQDSFEHLFYTLSSHILNSVFIIIDFLLYAMPYRLLHFYMPFTFSFVYVSFTAAYQASGGTGSKGQIPIYEVLDWRNIKMAIATCAVDLMCIVLVHCVFCVLALLKTWMTRTENPDAQ